MSGAVSFGRGFAGAIGAGLAPPARRLAFGAGRVDPGRLGGIFRIETGGLELYWQGGSARRRRLLGAFAPGAVIFPATLGRQVEWFAPDGVDLVELGPAAIAAPVLAHGCDGWIGAIAEALSDTVPPDATVTPIVAGPSPDLVGGAIVAAAQEVLWLEPAPAQARYYGVTCPGRGMATEPTPIAPRLWLRLAPAVTEASASAVALRSIDLAHAGRLLAALTAFGADLLALAEDLAARDEDAVRTRTTTSDRDMAALVAGTSARLVEVLAPPPPKADVTVGFDGLIATLCPGHRLDGQAAPEAADFAAHAEARGLHTRQVALPPAWWREDHGDLVGFFGRDRDPVALKLDWRGRYRLIAPGARPRLVDAELGSQIHFDALSLTTPLPLKPLKLVDVALVVIGVCRAELVVLALATALATAFGFVLPIATGAVVDIFVPDKLRDGVLVVGAALVVIMLGNAAVHLVSDATRLRIDGKLGRALQSGMMDRLLRLPSHFVRSQSSADLALRLMSVEQMRRLVTGLMMNSMLSGVLGLSGLVVLVRYSIPGTLTAMALLLVLVGAAAAVARAQIKAATVGETMTANLASLTLQIVQNVVVLRAFGSEPRAFARWGRNASIMRSRGLKARYASIAFETFLAGFEGLALASVVLVLGLSTGADLSAGAILAFFGTFQTLLGSSEGLARGIVQLVAALPTLKRAGQMLAVPVDGPETSRSPGTLAGQVEFAGIAFTYPGTGRRILDDLDLVAESGRFTAIVGPSGSGKSTLLSLLLGLDVPDAGSVLFDGRDLATLDKRAVRRQIGVVRQNGRLFSGSVMENILGSHDGTIDDAWAAARLAGVADEIAAMPMGMHTMLTDGIQTLSGGQIQRILIARALAGRPQILVLDEATSALDNLAQHVVSRNLAHVGVTRIVVAHRLSTIRDADRIYMMVAGRIVEAGRYDELMALGGAFAQFASRQLL